MAEIARFLVNSKARTVIVERIYIFEVISIKIQFNTARCYAEPCLITHYHHNNMATIQQIGARPQRKLQASSRSQFLLMSYLFPTA